MKYLFLFGFLLPFISPAHTQISHTSATVDSNFHIYLALGQSNMAGRGKVEGKYSRMMHDRVYMMDREGEWVQARHPVHFDKPSVIGVGPSLSFGFYMARKHKKERIGLVPCAVGGTSIELWTPGAYDDVTGTHPWDDAEWRIREAMKHGIVKGVIWHQGESDARPDRAERYIANLTELIDRLRRLTGNPQLPVVVGELGQYREVYQTINQILAEVPQNIPYTAVAVSKGLSPMEDGTHFTAKSAHKLGLRMAHQMHTLEKKIQ
ncbi:MAG TPA: sialate O-acetylesterase [Membranihabitans sp.]|nr:sialate O-acetylesterase [Membranihabitans sp.]